MSGAFFYIEYQDGRVTEIEFKTPAQARRAYENYAKQPELTARGWGWDTRYEAPELTLV
jgi:hypothetical protein